MRRRLTLPVHRMKKVSAVPIMTINAVTAKRAEEESPRPTRKNKIKPVITAAVKLTAKEYFKLSVPHRAPLLSILFN